MTEFKGDKRTREYKEWKAKQEQKSKGLGDSVEKVLEKTGIAKVAKFILGEDCGCDTRKESLNRMFPYNKPECLTEDEYNYLSEWFGTSKTSVTREQQQRLVEIHNRVFKEKAQTTGCTPCFVNGVQKKLKKIYDNY